MKWLGRLALVAVLLVLLLGGWLWWRVRASLPRTEGELRISGLEAPVTVSRDRLGIPKIAAATLEDAVRAQGFVHAQDRFFQMDLSRRATAGELSALFGARALEADRDRRRRQRRQAARRLLDELAPRDRALLEAYAGGVNAGLEDLGADPWEYVVLRQRPEPWLPEDTMLVTIAFFDMLSFNHRLERQLGVMEATLPAEWFDFLTPSTSRFDAPLIHDEDGLGEYRPMAVPGPEVLDLSGAAAPGDLDAVRDLVRPLGVALGSNNWAVAAGRSVHGGAILANDPHLSLRVPSIWHRVEFEFGSHHAVGVGSPGLPGVILGSNGTVAWGATNSFFDQTDTVVVEVDPDDPDPERPARYRTADGWEPFEMRLETIAVAGGDDEQIEVAWTRWGPVESHDWLERPLVIRSPVHEPGGIDFDLMRMIEADGLEEAMVIAGGWHGPSQNWMLAAADGRIGWVVNGPLPQRRGWDGKTPRSWADGDLSWEGWREGPRVVEPADGKLFTANGRTVPHAEPPVTHVWMHPGRADRIRERLEERPRWDEAGLQAVQLDTRSRYHDFVRELVLASIAPREAAAEVAEFRRIVEGWNGHADVGEAGFVLVATLAEELLEGVLAPVLAPAAAADDDFVYDWALGDEPVRRILEERPAHLVPPGYDDWDSFLGFTIARVASHLAARPGGLGTTWGEARPIAIHHPLGSLPLLSRYLNMPDDPLPGWAGSVRAQSASYGASMRMVVSPGREELGMLQMPGGQSGHLMSPNFSDQYSAWAAGEGAALLAGEAVSTFRLIPDQ